MPNKSNLGINFYTKLSQMCERLNVNPADMLLLMYLESGLDPSVPSSAAGLNQFIPSTLKKYFKGSPQEFRSLSGEDQLNYIERFFSDALSGHNVTSAAQLYIANFLPARLNDARVKQKNRNAILCQKGDIYYENNQGLDRNKDGKITYGDIEDKLNSLSKNTIYQQALQQLEQSSGKEYDPGVEEDLIPNIIKEFINKIIQSMEDFVKSITASRNNDLLIKVTSPNLENNLELARILTTAFEDFINAKCSSYTDKKNVEILCKTFIPLDQSYPAVQQFAKVACQQFCNQININDLNVSVLANKKPSYSSLDLKTSQINYRKFQIKLIGNAHERYRR